MSQPFCLHPWNKLLLYADGKMCNCCFQRPAESILSCPVSHYWEGKSQNEIRKKVLEGRLHLRCRSLHCPFKYKPPVINRREPVIVPPAEITELELSLPNTWCNIGAPIPNKAHPACIMCPRSTPSFQPDKDQVFNKVLEKVKPLVPNLKELVITGLAEPFHRDKLWYVFDQIGFPPHQNHIRFVCFTNGTLLAQENRRRLMREVPHFLIYVSIDAATPETYQRIRRYDNFKVVVQNLKDALADSERDRYRQLFSVANTINMLNVHEVRDMILMWKGFPLTSITFTHTQNKFTDSSAEINQYLVNQQNVHHFVEATKLINETAKEVSFPVIIYNPLEQRFK